MISLYGTTIQVMNIKVDYLEEALDMLSDIIEDYDFKEPLPANLKDYEIGVLLHEMSNYFEYGNEDNNIVTCIKLSCVDDK